MNENGWFGMKRHVLFTLDVIGADKDATGAFIISGKQVCSGLDGEEVVIAEETTYFKNGKSLPLAALMNSTSYGVRGITVIS